MAIRQHILPRFLLKGFASRIDGKEVYTWVYRNGGNVFETNIINVSVEKFFYGKDGEVSVDNRITSLEGEYGLLLDELRAKAGYEEIGDQRVPDFIAHLTIRSKHLRDSFRESSEFLVEKLLEYLSDFNNLRDLILSNPELMREELEKILMTFQVSHAQKDLFRVLLRRMFPDILNTHKSEFLSFLQHVGEMLKAFIPKAVKDGHIKALSKGLIPEPRTEAYRNLRWSVHVAKDPLILGDVGCIFEILRERRFKSINEKDDEVKCIFLPISSNRIVVGTSGGTSPHINIPYINAQTAKLSREFFVCNQNSSELALLLLSIGKMAEIISKEELEQIAKGSLLRYKAKPDDDHQRHS